MEANISLFKYFYLFIIALILSGCSYSLFLNAYPHIKNIQVNTFENSTSEFALAQEFQDFLVNQFQRDGRLKITTFEPDSTIEGSVLDYRHEIHSYDDFGNILEYRVSILFSIIMTDIRMQENMYENRALLVSEQYSPNNPNPDLFTTEQQAIENIFDKAFQNVIRGTLEAW